jgi:hypothetical protein
MAKRKSSSKVVLTPEQQAQCAVWDAELAKAKAANNPWHKHKFTKAEIKDSKLICQLPFIKDTRGEAYHADAGLYWWHVTNPEYWHQGVEVGRAFADRCCAVLHENPERIEQVLELALRSMVRQGRCGGIEDGFLKRLAHFAAVGMEVENYA